MFGLLAHLPNSGTAKIQVNPTKIRDLLEHPCTFLSKLTVELLMAFCAAKVSAVCEVERAATFLRLGRRPASPDRASLATACRGAIQ